MSRIEDMMHCAEDAAYQRGVEDGKKQAVRRGEWSVWGADKRGRGGILVCSACNGSHPHKSMFCPNCGADMRKED